MSDGLAEIMARHGLDGAAIAKIVGVSERTVRRWLEQDATPEPALRLLKIVMGEARPEDYRK